MPDLKGSKTHQNLRDAFAADAQLIESLGYYARIAEIEGYAEVAGMLNSFTESGRQFTQGHLDFLKTAGDPLTQRPIGATENNVQAVLQSHTDASEDVLHGMVATAHAEGFPDIASWFETLIRAKRERVQRLGAVIASEVER